VCPTQPLSTAFGFSSPYQMLSEWLNHGGALRVDWLKILVEADEVEVQQCEAESS